MEALLKEQELTIQQMNRILTNYKKGGKASFSAATAEDRLQRLRNEWATCKRLHLQLELQAAPEDRKGNYFIDDIFEQAQDLYDKASDFFIGIIASPAPATQVTGGTKSHDQAMPIARLPYIPLPTFTGSITEWPSFADKFHALVIKDTSLDDVQRLHYLLGAVTGEALSAIGNIAVTSANFNGAWNLLRDRYENKRVLVHALVKEVLSIPAIRINTGGIELRRLRDRTAETLVSLENIGRPVKYWDDLLVQILVDKLDRASREDWERTIGGCRDPPTYSEFATFLDTRIVTLAMLEEAPRGGSEPSAPKPTSRRPAAPRIVRAHQTTTAVNNRCLLCQSRHALYRCATFRQQQPSQRRETARRHSCCFNCLRIGHSVQQCSYALRCAVCNEMHHTLLHVDGEGNAPSVEVVSGHVTTSRTGQNADDGSTRPALLNCAAKRGCEIRPVILATVVANVETRDGKVQPVRVLLDQGSQVTLVTESLVQALGLIRTNASVSVTGAGGAYVGRARGRVPLVLRWGGRDNEKRSTSAFVLPRLTAYQPNLSRETLELRHLRGLSFADPDPSWRGRIEVILGADHLGAFLRPGLRLGAADQPFAQNTVFGWAVMGPDPSANLSSSLQAATTFQSTDDELRQQLRQFWELEEASPRGTLHPDDEWCENHFTQTVTRRADGRYTVRLPLKPGRLLDVGDSRGRALSVLKSVERRFARDRPLEDAYREFLKEYEDLDHMSKLSSHVEHGPLPSRVYLPHHPVVKYDGDGRLKIRVVFNASSKSSNGCSLNDHLLPGPKLQADICTIITRWRAVRIAMKADIEKMFRQIRVHDDDLYLQCIIWRHEAGSALTEFRLNTVTYGMNCAPFLAQRVLLQLAEDEGGSFPSSTAVLRENFYVDDVLFGGDTIEEAVSRRHELEALLHKGGFRLGKWAANTPRVLHPAEYDGPSVRLAQGSTSSQPVLGLGWCPKSDAFCFAVVPAPAQTTTNRSILSTIARLYDPLGWAAPVVIVAKILLQDLWLEHYDWDAPPAPALEERWQSFTTSLPLLEQARVSRWYGVRPPDQGIQYELHGFSDASSRAYGAVVYLVARDSRSEQGVRVSLVASRTKVAPLKTVSIPRLELCAAALLATLLHWVAKDIHLPHLETFAWTDSTVVLAWLSRTPSTWAVFVANRVAHVLDLIPDVPWRHVRSGDNPADCASRGMMADELLAHGLWWKGPIWLTKVRAEWPSKPVGLTTSEELRVSSLGASHADPESPLSPLPGSVSSWAKLLRVTARALKYVDVLHSRVMQRIGGEDGVKPSTTHRARVLWLRWLQESSFGEDLTRVKQSGHVGPKSRLRRLSPFLDTEGLLRVGGRLAHARLPYREQHPILLPKHPVTELIVRAAHLMTLHGGPQLTLSVLRRTYWLMGARGVVRSIVWQCVACTRHRAAAVTPAMAPLPKDRVTPSRPFAVTGVDYAGPIRTRTSKGRGHKSFKSYVAVFVCFATRAVHLELVSDCTTAAFLAALRRFISRRGCPTRMFSDNGTNFRGAARELYAMSRQAVDSPEAAALLGDREIEWRFSPPGAPHFGGLWEAAVKSAKHHLRRVIGETTLTFEEMTTLLCTIEACLNSRPLSALSPDPSEPAALTPGHFLVGAPLLTLPGGDSTAEVGSSRTRWQLVRQATRAFWKRWQQEYLHTLQERSKWWRPANSLQVGDVVVIREANSPPATWRLARVTEVHPGSDGQVRVVSLRTASGTLVRPITQVVRLPLSHSDAPLK